MALPLSKPGLLINAPLRVSMENSRESLSTTNFEEDAVFAVGQEIECVNDAWELGQHIPPGTFVPKKGDVVHCAGYLDTSADHWKRHRCRQWIFLQESNAVTFYAAEHFRALTKRTYSIEVFKKMETPRTKELEPM